MTQSLARRCGIFAVAVFAALGAAPSATMAAPRQPAVVLGPGFGSCSEWTAAHRGYSAITSGQDAWLLGYLSAYSAWGTTRPDAVFGRTDNAAYIGWVSGYCADHPQSQIATAAHALIGDLNRRAGPKR
jgi:hypothetical protein